MELSPASVPMTYEEMTAYYHRQLGKRASAAMTAKARTGGWIGCAPTGYRNVRAGQERLIEIDPVLGPLVHEAFRLVAHKRSSLQQVLTELTPRGLVSRSGKPLGASALAHIIANPFYVGMIRYQGHFYEGKHQALVTPSLFDRAGRSLRRRRR
jgi:site-specific DNA recombinase